MIFPSREIATLTLAITNRASPLHSQYERGKKLKPQFRASACLVGAPYGWIPTVTPFPRNDKSEWNASVGYIATLKLAMTELAEHSPYLVSS